MSEPAMRNTPVRSIRVVILHPHFTLAGGAGTFVLEVSNRLVALGMEVTIVCIKAEPQIIQGCDSRVRFIQTGGALTSSLAHWLLLPLFLFRVVRLCRQLNPDILFPQVFPANWWGFSYKLIFPRTKLLWMCQEPSAFIHSKNWIAAIRDPLMHFLLVALNPALKVIDRFLARNSDYVFANSNYGASYAQEVYSFPDNKLAPLYLGVGKIFSDVEAPSFEERRCQIITICRLTKFKNVDLVIKAVAQLRDIKGIVVDLKVVGRGEEEANLQNLADTLKVRSQVHFCGALSNAEMVEEITSSRAFVLASVDEPFGLVVVEAMACGTPAIVINSGGPAEIVLNGESGFHIPPHDIDKLVEYLELLLLNRDEFTRLSLASTVRAADFDWDKTAQKLADAITEMVGHG